MRKKVPGVAKKREPKRVRIDPAKEYAETMKAQGIATISKMSNDEAVCNITGRISTGSLALDAILTNPREPEGWAGIPLSRVTEIFGPPFIGKSTLLDHVMASVQQAGGRAILIDTEISRDRHYTQRLGVDLDALDYLEFERGEMYIENIIQAIYKSIDFWAEKYPETPVVLGWDALGGTATKDEWEKGMQSEKAAQPGAAAKAMHAATRQLAPRLGGTKIALVILNHEYEMINTGGFGGFQKKRETYGGSGVRHAGSLRIQLYNAGVQIKRSDGWVMGRVIVAKPVKNRLGASNLEAYVPIISGVGVDNMYTVFEELKKLKIIVTSGGWSAINLDGQVLNFQGLNGLQEKCNEDKTLFDRLVSVWRKAHAPTLHVQVPEVPTDGGTNSAVPSEG